ncbi:M15 family metallopeptidase [Streptomyces sp. NPDC101132]|uniref:M15 family metallopeptidase n=1 Tax=Streptomyces sp. NPDC101132 TaxID=3366110 RepID=UPI00381231F9
MGRPKTALALLVVLCSAAPGWAPSAHATAGSAQQAAARVGDPATPVLAARVTAVPPELIGATYRPGCPVPPGRLRLIRMNHWGFDGRVHRGEMVVHEDAVRPVLHAFGAAFRDRFPIRRMRVMAAYGGDDRAAMADDNTSAFNCRAVTGRPGRRSQHAYGDAVDVNPAENPYVDRNGTVHPPAAAGHLVDREPAGPGVILADGALATAFREAGWEWGGHWSDPDYQHFSANGH